MYDPRKKAYEIGRDVTTMAEMIVSYEDTNKKLETALKAYVDKYGFMEGVVSKIPDQPAQPNVIGSIEPKASEAEKGA